MTARARHRRCLEGPHRLPRRRPVPHPGPDPDGRRRPTLAATVVWFPVVGALIGALTAGSWPGWPTSCRPGRCRRRRARRRPVTGAFHEDGLADTADAVAGGSTRAAPGDPRGPPPRHVRRRRPLRVDRAARRRRRACSDRRRVRRAGRRARSGGAPLSPRWGSCRWPSRRAGCRLRPVGQRPGACAPRVLAVAVAAMATGWWAGPLHRRRCGAVVVVFLAWRAIGGVTGDILGAIEQIAEMPVLIVVPGLASWSHRSSGQPCGVASSTGWTTAVWLRQTPKEKGGGGRPRRGRTPPSPRTGRGRRARAQLGRSPPLRRPGPNRPRPRGKQ